MIEDSKRPLRVALSLLVEDRVRLAVILSTSLVAAIFEGATVAVLVPVLNGLTDTARPASLHLGPIDTRGLTNTEALGAACLISFGLIAVRCVSGYIAAAVAAQQRERIMHALRRLLFDRLSEVGLGYFGSARAGALVSNLSFDLYRADFALATLTVGALNVILATGYVIALVLLSPPVALLTLVLMGTALFATSRLSIALKAMSKHAAEAMAEVTVYFTERLSAARLIRVTSTQAAEREAFAELSDYARTKREREAVRINLLAPMTQFVSSSLIFLLVFVAYAFLVSRGRLGSSTLLAFFFALFRLAPLLQQLVNGQSLWTANRVGIINAISVADPGDGPAIPDGDQQAPPLETCIEFDDVSFEYEPDRPVLIGASLRIAKGSIVALVGASGVGKSTVADLLARFYDPTSGVVRWEGVDLRQLSTASLRSRMGIVSQETFVLHASVRDNVRYGMPDVDDEQVWEALAQADAEGYVRSLPLGLDAVVGERGALISGGQRQRLAIARALLRDPELLILDEATSALDPGTERAIQGALARLMKGRTSLVITHRLTTIENADTVHVLDGGRIVESGTYAELLLQGGKLAELHKAMYERDDL